MSTSRRDFLRQSSLLGTGLILSRDLAAFATPPFKGQFVIGAITYSFRSMPTGVDDLMKYCKEIGLTHIELSGDPGEAFAGSPMAQAPRPVPAGGKRPEPTAEEKATMEVLRAKTKVWRETTSMDKYVELRKRFKAAGISIYAFKPNCLGPANSDGEIEYAMKAGKALGADAVTVEVPTDPAHSQRLGDLAAKHKIYVGYHNHTQATDTLWDTALAQSKYNTMNLDCGHYIAAGGANTPAALLALIEAKHTRITSLHMKDRKSKENGGANMEWGKGDTPIVEILQLLQKKKYSFPVSIELEYPIPAGSDAVQEVKKCMAYAKAVL
jgi:sugar phosphate isomerase/epimerase